MFNNGFLINTSTNKKYNSLDLFKFFMAICVIAIHTNPLQNCTNRIITIIYDAIVPMAVPFFFLASGFLMANKFDDLFSSKHNEEVVKKTLLHIIKLYVLWTVVYLPMTIFNFCHGGGLSFSNFVVFMRGFIFIGEQYNSWQLWYLLSTIYALILVWILIKLKTNIEILLVNGVVFLFIGIFVTWLVSYDGELSHVFQLIKIILSKTIVIGRIFYGLFYIPLGIFLQKKRMPKILNMIVFIFAFSLNQIIHSNCFNTLLLAITSMCLFCLILEMNLKDNKIFPLLRKMSTIIYLIHMYIWAIYYMVVYHTKTFGLDSFVFTTLISIFISFIYCEFGNCKKL